ncbi:hypothetical protein [Robinsoniella peoriensis]|uniref:hypothetical protein n=1 Tax=Robinsoniella peoriensis TaxID=180332 RepID=UPI0036359F6F
MENMDVDGLGKSKYYETLFGYALNQTKYIIVKPSDTIISRTISGERNVVSDIVTLYKETGNYQFLKQDTAKVLEHISDQAYVNEKLGNLLWNDITITDDKKKELSEEKESLVISRQVVFYMGCPEALFPEIKKIQWIQRKKVF